MSSLLWLTLFSCAVLADPTSSTAAPIQAEEDESFSKWDGIGLIVSISTLLFFFAFCYVKEVVCKPDDHGDVPKRTATGEVQRWNPSEDAVTKTVRDIWSILDVNKKGTMGDTELQIIFGDRTKALLKKYDWDKTGDLDVFEVQRIFDTEFPPEFADKTLLDLQKKNFGKAMSPKGTGAVQMSKIDDLSRAKDVRIDVTTANPDVGGTFPDADEPSEHGNVGVWVSNQRQTESTENDQHTELRNRHKIKVPDMSEDIESEC